MLYEILIFFLFSYRKCNKMTKFIEENKEKFNQLDLQDVKVRENLKHAKSKAKKLEKQLQKDKEKVGGGSAWKNAVHGGRKAQRRHRNGLGIV